MATLHVKTRTGGKTALQEDTIAQFKMTLRGELIQSGDANYDEARSIYNAMIDRHPAFIVRCADVADVISAVNYARDNDLLVSIRSGGHNGPGLSLCDDGLVIDLSRLRGIRVDPEARTVRVEAGCTWGDVDHATHAFGLATVSGVISTTGVGGLTLGGGHGYLSLYQLHPVNTIFGGPTFWSLDQAEDVLRWYREFLPNAPEDLYGFFAFLQVPPAPLFPEALHQQKVCGVVWCYTGPLERAEAALKPVREFGPPIFEHLGEMPYPALQSAFDVFYPPGYQWYWKGDFVRNLTDDAIAEHLRFKEVVTPVSTMHLYPIDGAVHRVGADETAWGYRDATWSMVIAGVDPSLDNAERITEWARDYWQALHPHSAGGSYVNFMMEEGQERIQATYRDNYNRLVRIKTKYDPDNRFQVNHNIKPSA